MYELPMIWQESRRNPYTFETGLQLPLKDLICKMTPDEVNPQLLRIRPKALYKRLAANGFQ